MGEDTLVNALVGAVLTVALAGFVGPAASLVGGGVAGYLQASDGPRVGALAGLFAAVPLVVFVLFIGSLVGLLSAVGAIGAPAARFAAAGAVLALLVAVVGVLASVGLSALGGWVGVYVATETGSA